MVTNIAAPLGSRFLASAIRQSTVSETVGERVNLFGVPLCAVTFERALETAERMIERGGGSHVVVTPNTVSLMRSRRNDSLLDAYRCADMAVADGIGLVWAAKTLGLPLCERIPGIALAEELLRRGDERGYRVFLLGGREGVAVRAKERLLRRFPGLEIVGAQHGYFVDEEEIIDAIGAARPDILLVGMGVPRQELFMMRIRDRLDIPLMIGVGGALDIFSGDRARAPLVWQRLGLEWLYRLLIEPHRLREAILIPRFMLRVLWARATRFRPDPSSIKQIDSL